MKPRYRDHVDPEYRRWGRVYRSFPGVDPCVRMILDGKARGAWLDIIVYELAENAEEHLEAIIDAYHRHRNDDVATHLLMALELAALPASVEFLAEVLRRDDATRKPYARRALNAIDAKEARRALHKPRNA